MEVKTIDEDAVINAAKRLRKAQKAIGAPDHISPEDVMELSKEIGLAEKALRDATDLVMEDQS